MDDTTWKFVSDSSENPSCLDVNSMCLHSRNSVPGDNNDKHRLSLDMVDLTCLDVVLDTQMLLLRMSKNNIENKGGFPVMSRLSCLDDQDMLVFYCRGSRVKLNCKTHGDNIFYYYSGF